MVPRDAHKEKTLLAFLGCYLCDAAMDGNSTFSNADTPYGRALAPRDLILGFTQRDTTLGSCALPLQPPASLSLFSPPIRTLSLDEVRINCTRKCKLDLSLSQTLCLTLASILLDTLFRLVHTCTPSRRQTFPRRKLFNAFLECIDRMSSLCRSST